MEISAPLLGEPLPVELMNTIWADREGVHDALADPDEALAWLSTVALRMDPPIGADLAQIRPRDGAHLAQGLRRLRDALRRLAGDATNDERPAAVSPVGDIQTAVADLNRAAAAAPLWPAMELGDDGNTSKRVLRSAKPASEAAVARIAGLAVTLFTGPERQSLRGCYAPGCVLYFVKGHPRREWCSAGCGNRARVARHYQRHLPARP